MLGFATSPRTFFASLFVKGLSLNLTHSLAYFSKTHLGGTSTIQTSIVYILFKYIAYVICILERRVLYIFVYVIGISNKQKGDVTMDAAQTMNRQEKGQHIAQTARIEFDTPAWPTSI